MTETVFITNSEAFLRSTHFPSASRHLVYPWGEGRDFGVDTWGLLCPAGVTPGRDPINHPTPAWALAHQRTSAVSTATVHTSVGLDAASAEHPACESAVEMLLTVTTGKQVERRLLQGLGVRAAWEKGRGLWASVCRQMSLFFILLCLPIRIFWDFWIGLLDSLPCHWIYLRE